MIHIQTRESVVVSFAGIGDILMAALYARLRGFEYAQVPQWIQPRQNEFSGLYHWTATFWRDDYPEVRETLLGVLDDHGGPEACGLGLSIITLEDNT